MENLEKTQNKTKVLVNVYEPLIRLLRHKLDEACLKRDAYLDLALRCESRFLWEEVTTPNSERAKSFIAESLKQLPLKPLNLLLSTETVDLMNKVCQEKFVPRDAFINRFILLLIASDTLLEALFFEENDSSPVNFIDLLDAAEGPERWFFRRSNVLDTVEDFVKASPFWRLRCYFEGEGNSTYQYEFSANALTRLPNEYAPLKTPNALGFNTHMSDHSVYELEDSLKTTSNKNREFDRLLTIVKKEKQAKPVEPKPAGKAT